MIESRSPYNAITYVSSKNVSHSHIFCIAGSLALISFAYTYWFIFYIQNTKQSINMLTEDCIYLFIWANYH